MNEMVFMPKADYMNSLDAVREQTGSTELIKSGELAGKISAMSNTVARSIVDRSIAEYIDESVEAIGSCAFRNCMYLQNVHIPAAKSIGFQSFYGCYLLKVMDLPSATSIGAEAFYLTAVQTIILRADSVCTIQGNMMGNMGGTVTLYVPAARIDAYREKYVSNTSFVFATIEGSEYE